MSSTGLKVMKKPNPYPQGMLCQKCWERGHWSFECKSKRKYLHRASRTTQLKKALKKQEDSSVEEEKTHKTVQVRKTKKKSPSSSETDSSADSDSSSSSSSDSNSSSSSSSDSDSDSSSNSSSSDTSRSSSSSGRKKKKFKLHH